MKPINLNGLNDVVKSTELAGNQNAARPKAGDVSSTPISRVSDQVDVSERAGEYSRTVDQAKQIDVRADRVEYFRQLVSSGRYHVSSHTIADAIIRDDKGF